MLEVSSFQLESTEQFHPAIAVILNITPDHLDRHGTFENYALAKERIFAAQDANDCVVLNADNARAAEAAARSRARVYWFSIEAQGRAGRVGRERRGGLSLRAGGRNRDRSCRWARFR